MPTTTSDVIDFEKRGANGAIGLITINNPPANALSFAVVKGALEALNACLDDDGIKAVVLTGAGRMFVAGADIREFSIPRPDDVPELNTVIDACEASPKPVVAAINGIAFGGGLELAMGCHYRLISAAAQVGQPEVNLGIIPGGGGTQRLPRLAGIDAALRMCVYGKPIKAEKAGELGIADEVVEGDIVERALAFAGEVADQPPRRTGEQTDKLAGLDRDKLEEIREDIKRKQRGVMAPLVAVDMIEAAATKPFEEGLRAERDEFVKLRDSDQSAAMRYMFFAEREAAKIPDIGKDVATRKIEKAAIVGSGLMGGGIAMNFANAGIPVTVLDVDRGALDAGLAKVKENYDGSVSRGRMTEEQVTEKTGLITGTTDYADLADADIVIEAALEDMDLKKRIFATLDETCKPDAILASNTSSLDIDEIAAATNRPDKVVGMHFFSPANVMKLVENVRTAKASKESLATLMRLSKGLGKTGVMVGVGDGFVGNRMYHVAARIAEFLVEEGAMPWDIDDALHDWGFAMGPFAVNDLAGIDVRVAIRAGQKNLYPGRREPVIVPKLYGMGRYGRKTGKGWYDYSEDRKGKPDAEVEALILETSKELGIERREFSRSDIIQAYLAALANTGAHVLDEGLAIRSSDIDVIWNHGYGFPRRRGGPMFHADLVGLEKFLAKAAELHEAYGDWVKPAELLKSYAAEGKKFSDFKAG